jgi:hypothetical protein
MEHAPSYVVGGVCKTAGAPAVRVPAHQVSRDVRMSWRKLQSGLEHVGPGALAVHRALGPVSESIHVAALED